MTSGKNGRLPAGFWTKGAGAYLVTAHVRGEMDEAETLEALTACYAEAGQTVDAAYLKARVLTWYVREARKSLGLPNLKEIKQSAGAKQELAAQA